MQSEQFQLHAEIEQRHWWFVARRKIVRRMVEELLPANCGKTIVDVGCGTGANIAALAGGYRTIGIDTSAEAIDLAQQRFPEVEFHQGFAPQDLGEKFAEADLVMLNDVLEHVADDVGLLSSLIAAAKPGSYFLITVPADMALWSPHDVAFGHFRRYDLLDFQKLWKHLRVRTILATHFNTRLYPLVRWIRNRNARRGESYGNAGTDFDIPWAPLNFGLKSIFESEGPRLIRALHHPSSKAERSGVSLIAILEVAGQDQEMVPEVCGSAGLADEVCCKAQ